MLEQNINKNTVPVISRKDREYTVEINQIPIHWDLNKGVMTFYGIDSALFWIDPSISNMLVPIVEELGKDLFRLLVAHSSSIGTEEDYHAMISSLSNNFEEGFLAWGQGVSSAGWGCFELEDYKPSEKIAIVINKNSWEISVQRNILPEKRWGAPFLQGKLIGIFSHAFGIPCWANDICHFDSENPYTKVEIFPSETTIENELKKLRNERILGRERSLAAIVDIKTTELQHAKDEIKQYSISLEKKVLERTIELENLNKQLWKEIEARKDTEKELEKLNSELLAISITDKLTGTANRRHFDNVILTEWNRAKRTGFPVALIIGDVDWFKLYNDTYGHQSGDECLKLVARVLNNSAKRTSDLVARYGGEEFAIILPITNQEQAINIAENMIKGFRDLNLPHSKSKYGYVTISLGIAVMAPEPEQIVDILIKAADDALYLAKDKGRNQYSLFNTIK